MYECFSGHEIGARATSDGNCVRAHCLALCALGGPTLNGPVAQGSWDKFKDPSKNLPSSRWWSNIFFLWLDQAADR